MNGCLTNVEATLFIVVTGNINDCSFRMNSHNAG